MSYKQLLGPLIQYLDQNEYGTKVEGKDGRLVDTGVQKLVDALREFVNNDNPINIDGPIQYNNTGTGPAFIINNQGTSSVGVEMYNAEGQYSSIGVGLGNEGLVANEVILLPWYSIDGQVAHCKYSNGGGQGGVTAIAPNDPRIFVVDAVQGRNPGIWQKGTKDCDVGSGYGLEQSGSGYRFDALGGNDTFYVVPEPLGGAGGGGGGGGGGGAFYGTITAVAGDSITVTLVDGSSVTAARPFYLRQSEFDGETIGGITYTYSGTGARSATDGVVTESQLIVPPYTVGNGVLLCETPDGNGVGGTTHMDVNSDARAWCKASDGCS